MKEALETDGETVLVFADDNDVFCLLIHHAMEYNEKKNMYLNSIKLCARTEERTNHNIRTVISGNSNCNIKCILFAHALSGCDTTSCINLQGKT